MPILNTAQNDLTTRTRALYLPLRNPNFCSEGLPVLYTANYRWPHFALTVATRYPVICVDSDYTSLPPTQASLHGARTTKLKTIDSIRSEDYLSAYLSLRPTHIKNDTDRYTVSVVFTIMSINTLQFRIHFPIPSFLIGRIND